MYCKVLDTLIILPNIFPYFSPSLPFFFPFPLHLVFAHRHLLIPVVFNLQIFPSFSSAFSSYTYFRMGLRKYRNDQFYRLSFVELSNTTVWCQPLRPPPPLRLFPSSIDDFPVFLSSLSLSPSVSLFLALTLENSILAQSCEMSSIN